LTGLWVVLWVALSFVFFAVTRFRLPVVAALLPWAGLGASVLAPGRDVVGRVSRTTLPFRALALAGVLGVLLVALPAIRVDFITLGVQRWGEQEPYRAAEALLRDGNTGEAIAKYGQANSEVADTRYGLAAALLREGDRAGALGKLVESEPADRFEPFVIRGEAARTAGDLAAARALFNERVVRLAGDAALRWAWDHFDPPVVEEVDLGSGLDMGYVRGFDAPEMDSGGRAYRWSGRASEYRKVGGPGSAGEGVSLVLSGWRPAGGVDARLYVGGSESAGYGTIFLANDQGWQQVDLAGVPVVDKDYLEFNTFVPGGSDPRLLGVRVSRIERSR
jgi:hypothetical protein